MEWVWRESPARRDYRAGGQTVSLTAIHTCHIIVTIPHEGVTVVKKSVILVSVIVLLIF